MNDSKQEQPARNTIRAKSIEDIQVAKSRPFAESLHPVTHVARRKRWLFASLIALILLGAIPIAGYVLQFDTNGKLVGLGVALFAFACGGFLIRHLVRVMEEEEDKLQEDQFNVKQPAVSPPEPNPAGQEDNLSTPLPEAGQNIK